MPGLLRSKTALQYSKTLFCVRAHPPSQQLRDIFLFLLFLFYLGLERTLLSPCFSRDRHSSSLKTLWLGPPLPGGPSAREACEQERVSLCWSECLSGEA